MLAMPPEGQEIVVCSNLDDISDKAGHNIINLASRFISEKGIFRVALSGGSTPGSLYRLLAKENFADRLEWKKIHLFWGDERCVPPSHRDSNYQLVYNSLISKVDIPDRNIHRIKGETGKSAAAEYAREIQKSFDLQGNSIPAFDLILLGIGEDAHTASLFPGRFEYDSPEIVTSVYVKELDSTRISLTPRTIQNASNIDVLVSGIKKAAPLAHILKDNFMPDKYPAQIITIARGRVRWLIDRAAASVLSL